MMRLTTVDLISWHWIIAVAVLAAIVVGVTVLVLLLGRD
jgi:hypothetical protein